MSLHELRPVVTTREVGWILGMTLAGISYGVLLTLSIICIVHLCRITKVSKGDGFWNRRHFFQGFVMVVLALNTTLQVYHIDEFIYAVFYINPDKLVKFYWNLSNINVLLLAMLTDGLLVSVL